MKPTLARKIFCIAALSCAALWSAHAVNLVADPGFEASADGLGPHPFSASWTNIDASGFSGVGGDSLFAHTGNNYAFLGAQPGFGSLSQSLSAVVGQSYTLSFWLANDVTPSISGSSINGASINGSIGNSFRVLFGGVQVFAITNQSAFGYTQFTINNLVATSTASALEFVYHHDSDFWRLDDISVDAQGVPETFSTIWLALPALGLVYFSRGRTQRSPAAIYLS